jgi:UDP-N-acetylglucosamine 2-epimerase (non-hydrolysing)
VVSSHREETWIRPRTSGGIHAILNSVAETYSLPLVVSTHPRHAKRFESEALAFPPAGPAREADGLFFDYVKLQTSAAAVLSDSGDDHGGVVDFEFPRAQYPRDARAARRDG